MKVFFVLVAALLGLIGVAGLKLIRGCLEGALEDGLGLYFSLVVRSNIITASSCSEQTCAGAAAGSRTTSNADIRAKTSSQRDYLPQNQWIYLLTTLEICLVSFYGSLKRLLYEALQNLDEISMRGCSFSFLLTMNYVD